jgi:hypothetical protein
MPATAIASADNNMSGLCARISAPSQGFCQSRPQCFAKRSSRFGTEDTLVVRALQNRVQRI